MNAKSQKMNEFKIRPALLKKSVGQLIKIATKHFNHFIRLRDSEDEYFICVSCQKYKGMDQLNAGHFYPTTKSATRFNEYNVNGQCIQCNMFHHGNLHEYEKHLRRKIGDKDFELLMIKSRISKRWDKFELIAIIEEYKERCKKMK